MAWQSAAVRTEVIAQADSCKIVEQPTRFNMAAADKMIAKNVTIGQKPRFCSIVLKNGRFLVRSSGMSMAVARLRRNIELDRPENIFASLDFSRFICNVLTKNPYQIDIFATRCQDYKSLQPNALSTKPLEDIRMLTISLKMLILAQ